MLNKIFKTVVGGFAGTSAMTLASALMSLQGQEFREPEHLSTLIGRLAPFLSKVGKTGGGWLAHFGMGTTFASVYVWLWENRKLGYSWKESTVLGAASGMIGVLIWKATFKIHPLTPVMNYNRFYLQRIPAHIVFAVVTAITYKWIREYEKETNKNKKAVCPTPIGASRG
jgi:uncharacterized membrane protein